MYDLRLYNNTKKRTPKTKEMLQKVLGYTQKEADELLKYSLLPKRIVINVSLEKAKEIADIFFSNDEELFLHEDEKFTVFRKKGLDDQKLPPIDYNFPKPLVTRDHLVNVYEESENSNKQVYVSPPPPRNIPKCPTCQSTKVNKISGTKRWLSVGVFGMASSDFGKTMVCENCGYKW